MGRKGVSKRKPRGTRPKPMTSGTGKRISSVLLADEPQLVESAKGDSNPISDWKNKPKKVRSLK